MLEVETIGAGPPLVLLHGWAMHGGIFGPLVRVLSTQRKLHVVDLPGHGASTWRADRDFTLETCVDALLDVGTLPRAPWLGWSLGGLVAMRAARRAPERVTGLVALAATPRFTRAADWPDAMDGALLAEFARDLEIDAPATVRRFLALEALGSDRALEEVRLLQAQLRTKASPSPRMLTDGLSILRDADLRSELPLIDVPTLWIGGARDRLVPWRGVAAAAALCPRAEWTRIGHAGHAPFLGHADEVGSRVMNWLGAHAL